MDHANLLRLIVLAAIWGASFLFMRVTAPVFGPVLLIEWRTGLAAVFLLVVALWLRRKLHIGRHGRHYLIVGSLNTALPFLLFAYAAQTLPASLLSVLNSLAPIFGAIIGAAWLRTPVTWSCGAGLLLGMTGVAILGWDNLTVTGWSAWPALLAGVFAPLCYSVASTYTKHASTQLDAFENAHGSMWAAFLIVLALAPFGAQTRPAALSEWSALIALGVVCTGIAYLFYFRLITDIGPMKALTVTFLIPVFGVLGGVLFLDEALSWALWVGGACVLLGTALVYGLLPLPSFGNVKEAP